MITTADTRERLAQSPTSLTRRPTHRELYVHAVILAPGSQARVPVLECADAMRRQHDVERVVVLPADSDADVDAALVRTENPETRLIVAGSDGVLRAVTRRMVRRALSRCDRDAEALRPPGHPIGGGSPALHLPPLGLLPLDCPPELPSLATSLGLPTAPSEVSEVTAAGNARRLDLFRNDRGGATLHGILLGTTVADSDRGHGRLMAWQAHVAVDDTVLSDGGEPILACAVANADGYTRLGRLPLLHAADPADGTIAVALALAVAGEVEVRRTRGRAISVQLRPVPAANRRFDATTRVDYTDDGVDFTLQHSCTWWVEPAAWALYTW